MRSPRQPSPARHAPFTSWRVDAFALFALAALTRFWALSRPNAVVFDEALYEEYISHYFTGTFYFNLHPPVGKLLLALAARLLGISPATLAHPDPAVALRVLPALAGALIIPVFYVLLRQLGASGRVARLGSFLLLLDNALLAVSRFILIDSLLILFLLGALSAYLASERRVGTARWTFVVAGTLLAGLAAGTKWSGLSALALIGLLWLRRAIRRDGPSRQLAIEGVLIATLPAAVYAAAFTVHFALLPRTGNGDGQMSAAFRETLVGSPTYRPETHLSFVAKVVDAHRAMRQANRALDTATHPGSSPWWSWPILKHPLYVWSSDSAAAARPASTAGHVFIEGNPVLWWAALIGLVALGVAVVRSRGQSHDRLRQRLGAHRDALLFLLAGYLINYLPFAFISRILFLYSYLPALIFSIGLAVVGVGSLAGWMDADDDAPWRFPSRRSATLYCGSAALTLVAFLYFAPLTYGTPISNAAYERRLWLLERHVLQ